MHARHACAYINYALRIAFRAHLHKQKKNNHRAPNALEFLDKVRCFGWITHCVRARARGRYIQCFGGACAMRIASASSHDYYGNCIRPSSDKVCAVRLVKRGTRASLYNWSGENAVAPRARSWIYIYISLIVMGESQSRARTLSFSWRICAGARAR